MCDTVHYLFEDVHYKIHFKQSRAMLPVRVRGGGLRLLAWGRRKREEGILPLGGLARIASVQAGEWDAFFPKPVKLNLLGFTMIDAERRMQHFEIIKGQCVQGLVARYDRECRVYMVCVLPEGLDGEFYLWPRLMNDLWGE